MSCVKQPDHFNRIPCSTQMDKKVKTGVLKENGKMCNIAAHWCEKALSIYRLKGGQVCGCIYSYLNHCCQFVYRSFGNSERYYPKSFIWECWPHRKQARFPANICIHFYKKGPTTTHLYKNWIIEAALRGEKTKYQNRATQKVSGIFIFWKWLNYVFLYSARWMHGFSIEAYRPMAQPFSS